MDARRNTAPPQKWFLGFVLGSFAIIPLMAQGPSDWPMFGQSVANNAATTTPGNSIAPKQVARLKPKWTLTTGGDVSARAAVVNGLVYFPDWGGNIWAVESQSGHVVWSHQLSDYGLTAGTGSRPSPAVVNGVVYIGT